MGLVKCAVFVLLVGVVVCGENEGENVEDSGREMREFNLEGWRAVETFPTGDLGWIPREDGKDGEQVKLKRRRLRKRKRRPPLQESDREEAPPRRRLRPFRLDQVAQPWDETGEDNEAPHKRRRIPLPYPETTKANATEEEASVESSMMVEDKLDGQKSIADLKNLLKQSGGRLSLSEILQQKNLSLAELLQGNEKAISALTEKPQTTTELSNKHKLPPGISTTEETALTREETTEAQRKRLAVLQPKENKIFTTLIKFDVINEPTTDRRIFIPANSKFTGVEYINIEEENTMTSPITTTTTTTTEKPTTTTTKSTKYRSKLPTTNAKLRVTTKKVEREPIKINIKDIAGFHEEPQGPMKVSLDIEKMFEMNETSFQSETTTNASEDTNTTYVTAKQEIMEVMKDPASREKLSRILQHRNMTIEELVEQRERGSSQLHLADIFHNKTREPEPQEEPFVGQLSSEFFQNTYRQQKSTRIEEATPTKTASTEASTTPTTTSTTTSTEHKDPFPIISVEINKKTGSFPWKQLYPDLFPETNDIVTEFSNSEYLEKINMNIKQNNDEGFFNSIPSGVKSALFVSLAIIGLSIVVFLAVLLALKWIQSKNKSINYCSSLTAKLRAPMMLQGRPTTAIKSFMNETLGRKKNYYKSTLQSMSDEIWNRDRKESF